MTTTNDIQVTGHALYLEFVRANESAGYVTQIIVTPEGANSKGDTIPMTALRRRLSTVAPRKQWNHLRVARATSVVAGTVVGAADRNWALTNVLLNSFSTIFDGLKKNGYALAGAPILVEVVPTDLDDIQLGKTPYKLLGRIWKERKALGFPAEFIPVTRVHPATTVL